MTETIKLQIPSGLITGNSQEINYDLLKGKTLVGLCGFARSGKDSIAKILTRRLGFKRISFADILKQDLNEFFKDEVYEDLLSNNVNIEYNSIDFLNPTTIEIKEILRIKEVFIITHLFIFILIKILKKLIYNYK